jgi:DNA-directed RNA polymerase specialized sigma24 family protein
MLGGSGRLLGGRVLRRHVPKIGLPVRIRPVTERLQWFVRYGDEALAEDLLSEVFLAVWRQAASFEGRSSVSTWLLAIARNKAVSTRRRLAYAELDEESITHSTRLNWSTSEQN